MYVFMTMYVFTTMKVFNTCSRWVALLAIVLQASESFYKTGHWQETLKDAIKKQVFPRLEIPFGFISEATAVRIKNFNSKKKEERKDRMFVYTYSDIRWDNFFPA